MPSKYDKLTPPGEKQDDVAILHSSLRVQKIEGSMWIVAIAVHEDPSRNTKIKIPTTKGNPIGGIVHDALHECYLVMGMDSLNVGAVPVAFSMTMETNPFWFVTLPIPDVLLERYLSERQRHELREWRSKIPSKCKVVFLQMTHHNS